MSLCIELVNGYYAPRIRCDGCGQLIKDGSGNVVWLHDDEGQPTTSPLFFHKPCDCARPEFRSRFERHEAWEELSHFLVFLVDNSGVDMRQAQREVTGLVEMGLASPPHRKRKESAID